jgi:hypothetical protein
MVSVIRGVALSIILERHGTPEDVERMAWLFDDHVPALPAQAVP